MEAWNRLTDLRAEERGEDGKRSHKEYICLTPDTNNSEARGRSGGQL